MTSSVYESCLALFDLNCNQLFGVVESFLFRSNSNTVQNHGHKKQKDSLETRAVLLIFSLELEISGVAVQSIHQNSEKW